MTCSGCGATVHGDARYCTSCGSPLTDAGSSGQPTGSVSERIFQSLSSALRDRYRVVRPLGRGGMSYVFLAEEMKLDRRVAIKVLAPHLAEDASVVDRFMREARTVARLGHPNIVSIYDVGEVGDLHYFVMEFMSGKTLSDILKGRSTPLDLPVVTTWLTQVGGALDLAHGHDVVHRDIKPGNILFDRHGNAHVADFGIAKLEHVPRLTQVGMVLGTPAYMSPEQFVSGAEMGPATDQYSLGIVTYEMIAGAPPFSGSDMELFMAHREEVPPPLHEIRPEVPRKLSEIVARMIEKEPDDRYPTVGEAVAAMEGRLPGPGDPLVAAMADLTTPTGEVRIEADEDTVETGGRLALDATAYTEDGDPLPSRPVEWSTEDNDVVAVTPEGIVVGLAEGDATLIASCDGVVATHVIRVVRPGAGTAVAERPWSSDGEATPSVQLERGAVLDLSGGEPDTASPPEPPASDGSLPGWQEEETSPAHAASDAPPPPPPGWSDPTPRTPETPAVAGPVEVREPEPARGTAGAPTPTADGESGEGSRFPLKVAGLALVAAAVVTAGALALLPPGTDGPGSLVIDGEVPDQAEIRLVGDETELDLVPGMVTELPAGDYELRASAQGFAPFVQAVAIAPGETSRIRVDLAPEPAEPPGDVMAGLVVDRAGLPPGASVVLFGPGGEEPLAGDRVELAAGSYTVRITADGYTPSEHDVALQPGEERRLQPTLEALPEVPPATGTLIVSGDRPPGARVTVDGPSGPRPVPATGLDLPPGSYRVEVSAPEHRTATREVDIRGGESTRLELSPTPLPAEEPEEDPPPTTGSLTIGADLPTGGRLEILGPGGPRAATPGTAVELAPGSYTVRATAPEHETVEVPAEIRAGESTDISLPTLAPTLDAEAIARELVAEVVDRFDRRVVAVTELLPESDRGDFTTLWRSRDVAEWEATLQEMEGTPSLDGDVISAAFAMRATFVNLNTPVGAVYRFRARITRDGGPWQVESLERIR